MGRPVRVRSWGYIAFFWFVALFVSFSALAGVAIDWSWSRGAIAAIAVPLGLALRGLRYSVAVSGDEVVIRNLLRTYRLHRAAVTDVRPHNYDGFWVRGSETAWLATVSITAGKKSYTAYGFVGRHAVERAVDRIRELVGLPEMRRGPARHMDR